MEKEGIKYDKDKPRVGEMVKDFGPSILEVAKVWAFGADKYEKSNWKLVKNGADRYTNALLRHLIAEEDNPIDAESNLLHATHVAWNALARLWFILNKEVPNSVEHNIIVTPEGDTIRENDPCWIDYIKDFYENNKRYMDKKIEPLD